MSIEDDPRYLAWKAQYRTVEFPCRCGHVEEWRGAGRTVGRVVCSACGEVLKPTDWRPPKPKPASESLRLAMPPVQSRVTAANRGAMTELMVCVDLMARGIPVFRAVAPNCPCDLIAQVAGRLLRVEVKTSPTQFRDVISRMERGLTTGVDLVAYVLSTGEAVYHPEHVLGGASHASTR